MRIDDEMKHLFVVCLRGHRRRLSNFDIWASQIDEYHLWRYRGTQTIIKLHPDVQRDDGEWKREEKTQSFRDRRRADPIDGTPIRTKQERRGANTHTHTHQEKYKTESRPYN